MYYFKDENDVERSIHFIHHGRRKNNPPKNTECRICDAEKNVLGMAIAKRLEKFPVIFGSDEADSLREKYGRRVKEVMKVGDGETSIAIITADNFCYATARKVSLKKALENAGLSKVARKNAWHAVEIAHAAAAAIQAE